MLDDEGYAPIRSAAIVSIGAAPRAGEIVGLAAGAVRLAGVPGLPEGERVRVHFRIPFRHREVSLTARVSGDAVAGDAGAGDGGARTSGAPLRTLLIFERVPPDVAGDIERVLAHHRELLGADGSDASDAPAAGGPGPGSEAGGGARPSVSSRLVGTRYELLSSLPDDDLFANHRAIDRTQGTPVVVRILRPGHDDPAWLERFREAHLAARSFAHPYVVRVLDAFTHEGRDVVVTEPARAPRLTSQLASRGALELGEAMRMIDQVLVALEAIHEHGLRYGCLHPGRVRVTTGENVALTDLGVAAVAPRAGLGPEDHPLAYVAPDVRKGGEPDARSEVFSVGMLLYAMLLGECPYPPRARGQLASAPELTPPPVPDVLPELPERLAEVLARSVAFMPIQRHDDPATLRAALDEARAEAPPEATAAPGHQHRILVVEDDETVRHLIESALRADGHEVVGASDGIRGLEVAFGQPVDLVTLDLRMPNMDGFEFGLVLRNDPRTRDIPILVVTAVPEVEARTLMASARAEDLLNKPFSVHELLARVRALLERAP